jgi:hypothetical protein
VPLVRPPVNLFSAAVDHAHILPRHTPKVNKQKKGRRHGPPALRSKPRITKLGHNGINNIGHTQKQGKPKQYPQNPENVHGQHARKYCQNDYKKKCENVVIVHTLCPPS